MKRAAAAACLLAAACATTPTPPAQRLAGCWINRETASVTTMRWLPDQARPGALSGALLVYSGAGATSNSHYSLEPSEMGSSLCELDSGGAATRCWVVAEGESGSLERGRAFIDTHGERLRITIIGDGPERLIFSGRRDGCD